METNYYGTKSSWFSDNVSGADIANIVGTIGGVADTIWGNSGGPQIIVPGFGNTSQPAVQQPHGQQPIFMLPGQQQAPTPTKQSQILGMDALTGIVVIVAVLAVLSFTAFKIFNK